MPQHVRVCRCVSVNRYACAHWPFFALEHSTTTTTGAATIATTCGAMRVRTDAHHVHLYAHLYVTRGSGDSTRTQRRRRRSASRLAPIGVVSFITRAHRRRRRRRPSPPSSPSSVNSMLCAQQSAMNDLFYERESDVHEYAPLDAMVIAPVIVLGLLLAGACRRLLHY